MSYDAFEPVGFGKDIFKQRYAIHPEETWEDACRRIASFIASAERNGKRLEWEERFYKELVSNRFIPGGRIMYGAGRAKAALINCFVIGSDDIDSREGWAKNLGDMLIISGLGGGVGMNFSGIRPRNTPIHGTGGLATGAVSFMELINSVGEVIKGGGGRRSALMECLNIDHPDIIEFIDKKFVKVELDMNNDEEVISFVKKNMQLFEATFHNEIRNVCQITSPQVAKNILRYMVQVFLERNLRNANVSVVFNDDPEKFFEKVKNKEMHQLKWKGQVISEIRADKLWDKIISNALSGGEPGILNMYLANKASNISNVGPLVSTNPCGEIAMTPHEVCDLAHIVLPRFIRENGQVDWASLADTITAGIRFLDNVLDVTTYPTEEIKVKATNTRRLGLGITGLHDALLLMGLKYSSEEGRDAAAKIMKFVKNKSYEESVFLATERGVYGFYDHEAIKQSTTYKSLKPSVRHQIDERGLRNCALNTIAPCGCQKPDTLVLTNSGILELGELGDAEGETWQELKDVSVSQEYGAEKATQFFVNGIAETKVITLSSGIEIEGTLNHKYRVIEKGEYVWKRCDEIVKGDKIVVRMGGYDKRDEPTLINELGILHGNTKEIIFPGLMNKDLAEFLGIYFADGSNHDKGIRIACDATKTTHERVIQLSKSLFNIEPTLEEVRNCVYVCLNSQSLLTLLAVNGILKQKSHEISIPRLIRTSSRRSLEAFVHGYFLGDGHFEGNGFRTWDTVSKKMCQQMLVVLRSLGIYAKSRILPKDDGHIGTRDVYRLREFSMFSLGKEDSLRYVPKDAQEQYKEIKSIGKFLALDEVEFIKDSVSLTLDIEVPNNNTYLSNSVVSHNTNSIVSGVSSSAEPIMGPAYERMWWVGDEKNSEVVIHPLFEQFVREGKDVSHFEYAEEIDPKDHFRMQAALQEHIDNAISKTIAIPSTYSKKQFSEDLMEFLPVLKGITVYPIGSRGESPIKPLSIEKAIKVVKEKIGRVGTSQEQENQDCPNGVCSLG